LALLAEPFYQGEPESFWVNSLANLNSHQAQKSWRESSAFDSRQNPLLFFILKGG